MKQSTTSGTATKQMMKQQNDATVQKKMICTKKGAAGSVKK
jgi:hypothetical protein